MPKAKITFHSISQDTQNYASFDPDDDHMVSSIQFDLSLGSRVYPGMRVEVRQPYGTNYETEPLEVGRPIGTYRGEWNHDEFARACERYYRSFIGASGYGIRIGRAARNTRMRDNQIFAEASAEFDVPEAGGNAW